MTFNFMRFMNDTFRPGKVIIVSGDREAGKTHFSVALNHWNLVHRPQCVLLTNVIFVRVKGWKEVQHRDGSMTMKPDFEEHYPPNVYKVQSFEDIFKITANLLQEDPDTIILLQLDEVQNFMLADDPTSPMSKTFYRYLGNTRKFGHAVEFLTPSVNNIPKRIRFFSDDPRYSGNLNYHIFKSKALTAKCNAVNHTRFSPQELAFVKMSYDHVPEAFDVPSTSWTKRWEDCKVGDVLYDHKSSAALDLAEFDFGDLMRKVGGVNSCDVPMVMGEWCDRKATVSEETKQAEDPRYQRALRVYRMRHVQPKPVAWEVIERVEGNVARQTLQSEMKRYLREEDMKGIEA